MIAIDQIAQINTLPIWQGDITTEPLGGGLTNVNYVVTDAAQKYVVRLGQDIPEHQVMRFNELAASRAAHLAGLSPAVIHAQDGVTVLDFIECRTLSETDVSGTGMLERIIPLVQTCHREVLKHLRGPSLIFWVFHVIRDYVATLTERDSPHIGQLDEFLKIADELETAAAPFDIVFGHNDLLAANFLDDGKRLWLIDWDYAGFNSPLFDLGGLASNNMLSQAQEIKMLDLYFGSAPNTELLHRYMAMKSASLMREMLWSMVSELTSVLDVDFTAYTAENRARFLDVYKEFSQT